MKISVRLSFPLLGLALAGPSTSAAEPTCIAPPGGLVGWWRAESMPGDSAGGPEAVLLPGTGYGPGLAGQAFVLGEPGAGADLPLEPGTLGGAFAWEAWVRREDAAAAAVGGGAPGWVWSATAGWALGVETDGRLRLRVP